MKTRIIGLTGGIGSGKTTIARYYESLDIPVYIADDEAKKVLYEPGAAAAVKEAFGEAVFTDGLPDRKKLAEVVFGNAERLKVLNGIIHPRVGSHFKDWVKQHHGSEVVIKEAAILFESGSYKDCDAVILVTAPKELRLQRVMARDGVPESAVKERMASQWDEEKKRQLSNYIIENIDLETAKAQADKVLSEIKNAKN